MPLVNLDTAHPARARAAAGAPACHVPGQLTPSSALHRYKHGRELIPTITGTAVPRTCLGGNELLLFSLTLLMASHKPALRALPQRFPISLGGCSPGICAPESCSQVCPAPGRDQLEGYTGAFNHAWLTQARLSKTSITALIYSSSSITSDCKIQGAIKQQQQQKK